MRETTAYIDDTGNLHRTPEAAAAADERIAYENRVDAFVKSSTVYYEGASSLDAWLRTSVGRAWAVWLINGGTQP